MKELIQSLNKGKSIAIVAHVSPDPDCLSCMTALALILTQKKKNVKMFVDCDKLKEYMSYYNLPSDINVDLNCDDYDTIVAVDLPKLSLMGKYATQFTNHKNTIVIDHHAQRDLMAKVMFVDSSMSSCSEIILDLAIKMNAEITPRIASLIYAGIIGDTNCFENDNVNSHTFFSASKCFDCGAETKIITDIFKKHQSSAELKLKRLAYEQMHIENRVAYTILTLKMFKASGIDDCPTLVNEMLYTDDNLFSIVLKQKDKNTYTVSLRCKDGYDVSKVASVIGGGGHIQASGALFVGCPKKNLKILVNECLKQIKE